MKYMLFSSLLLMMSLVYADWVDKVPVPTQTKVELDFFWSHRCPHCLEAKPFVQQLSEKYEWLQVNSYDVLANPDNVSRYLTMAKKLDRPANSVPGFIFCGQMIVGFNQEAGIDQALEQALLACHQSGKKKQPDESVYKVPILGKIDARTLSLPILTLLIASLDAFNPCAFFVLLFLLSLMVHSQSRSRIAVIGGVFVLFSGIMYFLFMAAWLNLFIITGELAVITVIAGIMAIVIGIINIKDYFFFKQGFSLSIPDSAKPRLFQRIRELTRIGQWPAMLTATIVLAIAANSYELLCTAGLPMVYTRILTLHMLPEKTYYFYLILYNIVYVIPLTLIVVLYTWSLGNHKLSEQQGRILKLLAGTMMLGLGGMLLLNPDLLNNLIASIVILTSAIAITLIFYYFERKEPIKIIK